MNILGGKKDLHFLLVCHGIPNICDNIKLIIYHYIEDIDEKWLMSIVNSEYIRSASEQE